AEILSGKGLGIGIGYSPGARLRLVLGPGSRVPGPGSLRSTLSSRRHQVRKGGDIPATFEARAPRGAFLLHLVDAKDCLQGDVGPLDSLELGAQAILARVDHQLGAFAEDDLLDL